jgi:hypothetical protein
MHESITAAGDPVQREERSKRARHPAPGTVYRERHREGRAVKDVPAQSSVARSKVMLTGSLTVIFPVCTPADAYAPAVRSLGCAARDPREA